VSNLAKKYFNIKDFRDVRLEGGAPQLAKGVQGPQKEYDVFLSHSTKDKELIKKIRKVIEDKYHLSAYIDWEEDSGTSRDEAADVVKEAMDKSKSFLIVKTSNSDDSSWVPWETGYFDKKDMERIGVLLIEDEENNFTSQTFKHQEYLKNYEILEEDELIAFVQKGSKFVVNERRMKKFDNDFRGGNIGVSTTSGSAVLKNTGDKANKTTEFYGN
jgi:hypothetical protein